MVFDLVFKLSAWFQKWLGKLDEETKRQVIELTVRAGEELFRAFYRHCKKQRGL